MANEINRIVKLFADLQHGNCWVGKNFKKILQDVGVDEALKNIPDIKNNIWRLVAHITYWRTAVVNGLTGISNLPPFQDFRIPDEPNKENWKQALLDFEAAYHLLRNAIQHLPEDHLDKPSPKEGQTYYELIMGCLQHDAYHLGQMMILKKTS